MTSIVDAVGDRVVAGGREEGERRPEEEVRRTRGGRTRGAGAVQGLMAVDPAQRRLGAVAGHLQPRSRAQPRPLAAPHAAAAAAATPPSADAHEAALSGLFGADVSPPPGARVEQLSEHMGVRVRGIEDVRRLEPPNVRWLLTLLYRHRLLAVSGQSHLKLPEFSAFTQHFGRPEWEVFYKGTGRNRAPFVPDHPEVLCVTSLGPGSFSFDGARRPFLQYDLAKSAAQRDPSFVSNFQWQVRPCLAARCAAPA